jgi:hypothetical protein
MNQDCGAHLTREQNIFNGRLSQARRCVECAFGILANKWRILSKSIETNEEVSMLIVNCAATLHNVVIDKDKILMQAVLEKVWAKLAQTSTNTGRRFNCSTNSATAI